jgi:ligand-binding sensor domain-containing protein
LPASALDPGRRLTQYLQRIWQTRQGLPQSSIFAIHQTQDGYLWLGTGDGLVRFDGVRFTSPEDLDGLALPKMSVRQLAEDSRGGLWIATSDAGLFRIENGTVARFSQRDGLPSNSAAICGRVPKVGLLGSRMARFTCLEAARAWQAVVSQPRRKGETGRFGWEAMDPA